MAPINSVYDLSMILSDLSFDSDEIRDVSVLVDAPWYAVELPVGGSFLNERYLKEFEFVSPERKLQRSPRLS